MLRHSSRRSLHAVRRLSCLPAGNTQLRDNGLDLSSLPAPSLAAIPESCKGDLGISPVRGAAHKEVRMSSEHVRTEEFRVNGEQLLSKIKELLHEGNIRRVTIKDKDGK